MAAPVVTAHSESDAAAETTEPTNAQPQPVTELDKQVMALVETHCQGCHASGPTDDIFRVAPLGVKFDNWEQVTRQAPQIIHRTTVTRDMPFLNKSNMTDEERAVIASWAQQ